MNNAIFIDKIGSGGFGDVDKYRLPNGSMVAIKTFFPGDDNDIGSATLKELYTYQIFKGCPNIVQSLDIAISIEDNEILVKVMMPYHTSDLKKFNAIIPFLERLAYSDTIILQLLTGLYQLYERGVIHGDIKPENILIDYEYDKEINKLISIPQLYIADFGNSVQLSCSKEYRSAAFDEVYTFIYRPPELLNNSMKYNEKADIWAMGITLLEYFLGKHFIKHGKEITKNNIIHQLFSNVVTIDTETKEQLLIDLLSPNYHLYDTKSFDIRGYLDVDIILESNMSSFHYSMMPNDIKTLLIRMLAIDPIDRVSITELVLDVKTCEFIDNSFKRGFPIDINLNTYIQIIDHIIEVGKMFKFKYMTIISAIDLFDRYCSNYELTTDNKKYVLIDCACLLLSSKQHEIYSPELDDFVFVSSKAFTIKELKNMQIVILQRMNYNLISCEIDNYVHEFGKNPKLTRLTSLYFQISKDGKYPSSLSYPEIINYLQRV